LPAEARALLADRLVAFAEYATAASAYEVGQPGLGERFIRSVEGAIEGV
jgi:hypothetical protein